MKKDQQVKLFAFYFFINNTLASLASVQRIPFLRSLNYDALQRSYILSALALISILGQFFVGYLSDKLNTIRKISLILIFLWASTTFFMYNKITSLYLYHFIFLSLSGGFQNIQVDLNDGWALQSGKEVRDNFSLIKGFQSFGYVFGTILTSIIISLFNYQSLAKLIIIVASILFLLAYKLSDIKNISSDKISLIDVQSLLKSKLYLITLLLTACFFTITQIHAIVIADKILMLNGSELHISARVIVAVGLEAIGYLFCDKLYRRVGPYFMLFTSAIAYIIMYTLFIFATTPSMIVLFAALQIFAVPPYIVASKHLLFDFSPDNLKTSGQLFAAATMMGISGTLTPIFIGYLTHNYSINHSMFTAIIFAAFGLFLTLILKGKTQHGN